MGRHKDLYCPKCGFEYQVNASDLIDQQGIAHDTDVRSGTCPMCRFTADLEPGNPQHKNYPSYSGDRILVGKSEYDFGEPRRWDVIVFKYPGGATTNFIKRLVGLPGETVRIQFGDLWIRKNGGDFEIARKPSTKLLAMLQPVFDNDLATSINALGWPARWRPLAAGDKAGQWNSDDGVSFQSDGTAADEKWLRYQHLVPSYDQWQELLKRGALRPSDAVKPQLVADFTAYNTAPRGGPGAVNEMGARPDPVALGIHWVGDLALQCNLDVQSDTGEVVFQLIKGGVPFVCRIDVATGQARLTIDSPAAGNFRRTAQTAIRGKGKHEVFFANVDDELRLRVDGSDVSFDSPTTYDSRSLGNRIPTEADLSPAGIATKKAAVAVSHIKLSRDIYYIASPETSPLRDFVVGELPDLSDPRKWPIEFAEENMRRIEFHLQEPDPSNPRRDQFFVLGDNSAQSKDGRLWGEEFWVNRELLIGKALFIYWPHSWDQVPGTRIPLPFFPNFQRMHLVR